MTKMQLFVVSLVGAIPAGFLAYQLVMVFINHGGGPSVVYQGVVGITLLCAAVMALLPLLVLALFSSGYEPAKPAAKGADKKKGKDQDEEESEDSDDADAETEEVSDEDFEEMDAGELEDLDEDDDRK